MYLVFMSKVKMLPKATVDIVPIFGFAFGVDPHENPDRDILVIAYTVCKYRVYL